MSRKAEAGPEAVEALARQPRVARALELLEREAEWVTERHIEFTRIGAPTFGEQARGDWFLEQFRKLELERVRRDEVGNVLGEIGGRGPARQRRLLVVSAHLDTVFPAGSRIEVRCRNGRIYAPGITDNGSGLAALLALSRAFRQAGLRLRDTLLFVANVGEEGEGDLHGMRHLLHQDKLRRQVRYLLVLDGANTDHITALGLGSRRFRITVEGPGGHSWTDFGLAHPIYALASAVARFSAVAVPANPRTTFNVGEMHGGTSINSVPFSASIKVDLRSSSEQEIGRLSAILEKLVEQAVEEENSRAHTGRLVCRIEQIGDRPAAELPGDARILQTVRAVDAYLGIASRVERSSTDANIPLSLGMEAISLGGGGEGGGAHSPQEWYDPSGRVLGLKRLLLTICALAGPDS